MARTCPDCGHTMIGRKSGSTASHCLVCGASVKQGEKTASYEYPFGDWYSERFNCLIRVETVTGFPYLYQVRNMRTGECLETRCNIRQLEAILQSEYARFNRVDSEGA